MTRSNDKGSGTRRRSSKRGRTAPAKSPRFRDKANSHSSNEDLDVGVDDSLESLSPEEDVEFLDEDLLIEENTGEVHMGEIGEISPPVEDVDASGIDTISDLGDEAEDGEAEDGEADDDEATSLRAVDELKPSGRVQRLDLEDLEDLDGEAEDMSFLDRPTSELELRQEPDLMDQERRDPLKVADRFNTHESWVSTGEHNAAPVPDTTMEHDLAGAEEITEDEADEFLKKETTPQTGESSEGELQPEGDGSSTQSAVDEPGAEPADVEPGVDESADDHKGAESRADDQGESVDTGADEDDVGDERAEAWEETESSDRVASEPLGEVASTGVEAGEGLEPGGKESAAESIQQLYVNEVSDDVISSSRSGSSGEGEDMQRRRGSEGLEGLGEFPPLTEEDAKAPWMVERSSFGEQAHRLALRKRWKSLSTLTRQALDRASWAQEGPARAALLLDLGKIYRDHLGADNEARIVFEELLREDPSSRKALDFLSAQYEKNSLWEELFRLHLGSVENTWDPHERLERTRLAGEIAQQRLQDPGKAIEAWERLWKLGGGLHEVRLALTQLYRCGGEWKNLANFLFEDAQELESAARNLQLREVAELCLYGAGDLDRAKETVDLLLQNSPDDSIALLASAEVLARREDWDSLEALLGKAEKELDASGALGLRRWIADALWKGGRRESATELYRRVLEEHPDDVAAARAVEEALTKAERYEELVELLETRLDRTDEDEVKGTLLAKLAGLSHEKLGEPHKALEYWKRHMEAVPDRNSEALSALGELYERLESYEELAEVLSAELELRRDPSGKRGLLSKMGVIYSQKLQDDERAENVWRRMLVLDPEDTEARRELMQLHKRRGEYEALDRSLVREINLADEEMVLGLCREAAKNVEENLGDMERAAGAWWRVLDREPADIEALEAMGRVVSKEDEFDRWAAFVERRLDVLDDPQKKEELGLVLAKSWRELGDEGITSAAALYERVMRWRPDCADAAQGLMELWMSGGYVERALSVLEYGCLASDSVEKRAHLIRRAVELLPKDCTRDHYILLRWLVSLEGADDESLGELSRLAIETDMLEDFLCLLEELSMSCNSEEKCKAYRDRARAVCKETLADSTRAFLVIERGVFARSADPDVLEKLAALAEDTDRYEDLVAIYETLALNSSGRDERVSWLRKAADVLDEKLSAHTRAFYCLRRAALIDAENDDFLDNAKEMAEKADLWSPLERMYADVLRLVESPSRRMSMARHRHDVLMNKLDDKKNAFLQLSLMYRLSLQRELQDVISKASARLSEWDYYLPLLEGSIRGSSSDVTTGELVDTAKSYEESLNDVKRSVTILFTAAENDPEGFTQHETLKSLVESEGLWGVYSDGLRFLAALSSGDEQAEWYKSVADILETKLSSHGAAIEVHRRILSLIPQAMDSLELCIDHERRSGDQEALQQRLQQWIQNAPEDADLVPVYHELAELAETGGQPEKALLAYTQILEVQPEHEEAQAALESMADKLSPEQKLRRMKLELRSATGERATELHMALAGHQLNVLGDKTAAVETLCKLVEVAGREGEGGDLLARLLREEGRFEDLADFLEKRAAEQEVEEERLETLQAALQIRLEHVQDSSHEHTEKLCRDILEIRPEDRQAGVLLLHTLRSYSRLEEMADLLERSADSLTDETARYWALLELARIKLLAMEDLDDAKRVFRLIEELSLGKMEALTALAQIAMREDDWNAYIRQREQQAKMLPSLQASLIYCHLAEINDEHCKQPERTVSFYRKARMLDDGNELAKQALKALGRRVKEWRQGAALLPDKAGEEATTLEEQAEKLVSLAQEAEVPEESVEWLWRAVGVSPVYVKAWDLLAAKLKEKGELELSAEAQLRALGAFELTVVPGRRLSEEVERFHSCSAAFDSVGKEQDGVIFEKRAFDLDPKDARAALAVANEKFEDDDVRGAAKVYEELVERTESAGLTSSMRAHITYRLGIISLKLGHPEKALASFDRTLEQAPLHSGALEAFGGELAGVGRFAEAARMYLRAAPVTDDGSQRARINSRLGALMEDFLKNVEEAGACYKRALHDRAEDLDTLWRSLKYAQKSGKHDEGLDLITMMLEKVEDPEDMAGLWVTRGQIYAESSGMEDQAMEAFDMALSYDPGCHEALEGLGNLLERKGEWGQLLDVLEATQQLLSSEKQAQVLLKMASIVREQFDDKKKEESYLRLAVEIEPSKEILDRLYEIYSQDPSRAEDARVIIGKLVTFGPPFFEPVISLGKEALESDKRRWAWCLLSPLSEVRKVDKELKSALRDMRKEFDGAMLPVLSPKDRDRFVRHAKHFKVLEDVLARIEEDVGPMEEGDIETVAGGEFSKIGKSTGLGKVLKELCANLGFDEKMAYRADEMQDTVAIAETEEGPAVLLQADFARKLVQNEVRYVFGYALELIRKGNRLLSTSSAKTREAIIKGLFAALGWYGSRSGLPGKVRSNILEKFDEATLGGWKDDLERLKSFDPEELTKSYWEAVQYTARRTGLLMSGELHLSIRALERMEGEKIGRQVDKIEDLDEKIEGSPDRSDLLSWACTPGFCDLLTD